jgi:hypothetical protein
LKLDDLQLQSLPPIFHLAEEFATRLHKLDISKNELKVLPAEIGKLRQLQILDVNWTPLEALPKEIGDLQALKVLYVHRTRLYELPKEMGRLRTLESLNVSYTSLRALPKEIGDLQALKMLDLHYTKLNELPTDIGRLQKLESFNVSYTDLHALPKEIGSLQELTFLDVEHTEIRELPDTIACLRKLASLNVKGTLLKGFSEQIGKLSSLKSLIAGESLLEALPGGISQLQNLQYLAIDHIVFLMGVPEAILQLPPTCTVWLLRTGLPLEDLEQLRRSLGETGYKGPAIRQLMQGARTSVAARPIADSLQDLCVSAGRPEIERASLIPQDEREETSLRRWLHRLSWTREYRTAGASKKALAEKVWAYLEFAKTDSRFRLFFFSFLEDAALINGDQVDLSVLEVDIAYNFFSQYSPGCLGISVQADLSIHALRKTYWALGARKWKECIDGSCADYGKFVFDQGLHGREVEPGFIGSMERAFVFIGETLGQPMTPEWYLQLHRIACAHFQGKRTGTLIGQEGVGMFRDEAAELSCLLQGWYAMTPEGIREFRATELGTLEPPDPVGGMTLNYKRISRVEIQQQLQKYMDAFYAEMAHADTPDKKLTAIARFYQMSEWLHIVRDGAGRCDMAILNKLLTEFGFHPVILDLPYVASSWSLKQWTAYLKVSLLKWELEKNLATA